MELEWYNITINNKHISKIILCYNILPSILCILTSDSPIGHGLCGERVENTPRRSPPSRGGATLAGTWLLSVA